MKRISAGTVLALLAACGSAGAGGKARRSSSTGPALTIAGVGIGTSAADAQRVLTGGGWKVETFPGRDWATTVALVCWPRWSFALTGPSWQARTHRTRHRGGSARMAA